MPQQTNVYQRERERENENQKRMKGCNRCKDVLHIQREVNVHKAQIKHINLNKKDSTILKDTSYHSSTTRVVLQILRFVTV